MKLILIVLFFLSFGEPQINSRLAATVPQSNKVLVHKKLKRLLNYLIRESNKKSTGEDEKNEANEPDNGKTREANYLREKIETNIKLLVEEMRKMIKVEAPSVKMYNWLNKSNSSLIALRQILKLCDAYEVSADDDKYMLFIETIFEEARNQVPNDIRTERLDQACLYFEEIIEHLHPLYRVIHDLKLQGLVEPEDVFAGLRKDFLSVLSNENLYTVVLHGKVESMLNHIGRTFLEIRLSTTRNSLNNGKIYATIEDNNDVGKKQLINVKLTYADLIQDIALVYEILTEWDTIKMP